MVDCNDAGSKECHHAKHAANAFDTEKVALMHGIFQLLQTPAGESQHATHRCMNQVLTLVMSAQVCMVSFRLIGCRMASASYANTAQQTYMVGTHTFRVVYCWSVTLLTA